MPDLLIVNLYGTIIPEDREPVLRRGFKEFLEKYGKDVVISAYMPREKAEADLDSVGLLHKVKLYSLEDMKNVFYEIPAEYDTPYKQAEYAAECMLDECERRPDSYVTVPNIRCMVHDVKASLADAVIISDNPSDIGEAEWQNVRAIQIPTFKDSLNDDFLFDDIHIGSAKYKTVFYFQGIARKPKRIVLE